MEAFAEKRCSACGEEKSVAAFYRSAVNPDGFQYHCKQCQKARNSGRARGSAEQSRAWREANPERVRAWSAENKDYIAGKSARYRERHAEKVKMVRLLRYDLWPEKKAEVNRRWEKAHPDQWRAIANAMAARYRATKRNAALPWLSAENRAQILKFYDDAVALTECTGIRHEVDHIVPLRGKTVSGLHVPWNLQVIPRRDNRSKGNRLTI